MQAAQILRVFLAHPSDTSQERNACFLAAEAANSSLAALRFPIRVEVFDWLDAVPGFHPEGGQGRIEESLPLETFDLVVGILKHRIGTPLENGETGTQREIRRASQLSIRHGSPTVHVYFSTEKTDSQSGLELEQLKKVREFKQSIQSEALTRDFADPGELQDLVHQLLLAEVASRTSEDSSPSIFVESLPVEQLKVRGQGVSELMPDIRLRIRGAELDPMAESTGFTLWMLLNTNITGHCGDSHVKDDIQLRLDGATDCGNVEIFQSCLQAGSNGVVAQNLPIRPAKGKVVSAVLSGLRANANQLGVSSTLSDSLIRGQCALIKDGPLREIRFIGPSVDLATIHFPVLLQRCASLRNALEYIHGHAGLDRPTLQRALGAEYEWRAVFLRVESLIDGAIRSRDYEIPKWIKLGGGGKIKGLLASPELFQSSTILLRMHGLSREDRLLFFDRALAPSRLDSPGELTTAETPIQLKLSLQGQASWSSEIRRIEFGERRSSLVEISAPHGTASASWVAEHGQSKKNTSHILCGLLGLRHPEALDSKLAMSVCLGPTTAVFTASSLPSPAFADLPFDLSVERIRDLPALFDGTGQ